MLEYIFRLNVKELNFNQKLFSEILGRVREISKAKGVKNYIYVYLPAYERYAWRPEDHPRRVVFDNLKERVLSEVRKHGWEVIDIDAHFSISNNPLAFYPFKTHAHYTPKGYSLIAQLINNKITQ